MGLSYDFNQVVEKGIIPKSGPNPFPDANNIIVFQPKTEKKTLTKTINCIYSPH